MIILEEYQIKRISNKRSVLGQCEWFRKTYGCTMEVKGKYHLNFRTPQEETFFLLKYSNEINTPTYPPDPEEEIEAVLKSWAQDNNDWDVFLK